jgi:predicted transcriptional regulator
MKVVLPDPVADQLAELAKAVQESPSTLISAAWLDESLPLDLA